MARDITPAQLAQSFEYVESDIIGVRDGISARLVRSSASTTSADSGGPRPKLILKRTGAAGDTDPTPAFAPLGDIEWHTVHTDGSTYTAARIWVDEESTDPVVNVGRLRMGVHNGDALAYAEDTYLYLTGYGDVDLHGGNVQVSGSSTLSCSSSAGDVSMSAADDVKLLVGDQLWIVNRAFPTTRYIALSPSGITGIRTWTPIDSDGTIPLVVAAPASASATGITGQIASDASFFYICTATDTWKRVAIASW